jgi:hypothetical protein
MNAEMAITPNIEWTAKNACQIVSRMVRGGSKITRPGRLMLANYD